MPLPSLLKPLPLAGLLVLALGVAACRSPQAVLPEVDPARIESERERHREGFLREDEERRARLHALAFPLLQTSAELYPEGARPTIGIVTLSEGDIRPPYRETARRIFQLGNSPQVRAVAPGSPAEAAGLEAGDILLKAGGYSLQAGRRSPLEILRRQLQANTPLVLEILRGEELLSVEVIPVPLAPFQLDLVYSRSINARAIGGRIEMHLGMMEFCHNDTELAFVIAHEIAHHALQHHREFILNYLAGTAVDLALLALKVPSPNLVGLGELQRPAIGFEAEADYVALYLLARTGHDLNALDDFWPRLTRSAPERQRSRARDWTHPEPAYRHLLLLEAIEEIQRKQAAELPLLPPGREGVEGSSGNR